MEYLKADMAALDRPHLVAACLQSLNLVYYVLLVATVPLAVYRHLWLQYSDLGWVFALGPLAYLPVSLGWFPRRGETRILIASALWLLAALSINGVNDWYIQPGLYVLLPPTLAIYTVFGAKALAVYTACIIGVLSSATLANGLPLIDVAISMVLWLAVGTAGCAIVDYVVTAAFQRDEAMKRRLAEVEARELALEASRDSLLAVQALRRQELHDHVAAVSQSLGCLVREQGGLQPLLDEAQAALAVLDEQACLFSVAGEREPNLTPITIEALTVDLEECARGTLALCQSELVVERVFDTANHYVLDVVGIRALLLDQIRLLCAGNAGVRMLLRVVVQSDEYSNTSLELALYLMDPVDSDEAQASSHPDGGGRQSQGDAGAPCAFPVQRVALMDPASIPMADLIVAGDDGGSGIRIVLRLQGAPSEERVPAGKHHDATLEWLRYRSVMLVEDNPVSAHALKHLLEQRFEARVTVVRDGREALTLLAANRVFDLLIADDVMPRCNAAWLFERIRLAGRNLPLIGMTSAMLGADKERLLACGSDGVLAKPVEPAAITQLVAEILQRRGELSG